MKRSERKHLAVKAREHAALLAKKALASRETHEASALKRKLNLSDDQFTECVEFVKRPRQITLMGSTVTATFDGVAVATRTLVLQRLAAPLEASAAAVAAISAAKPRRRRGVPVTSRGLGGADILTQIDQIAARRATDQRVKEDNATARKTAAAAKLQCEFEGAIPRIVEKMRNGTQLADLPRSNISLLVRWLQGIRGGAPKYKVKAQPSKDDLDDLLDEYRRVTPSETVLRAQLDALTSSREARETAIAGVCGCCKSPTVVDGADDTWLGCGGADCAHSGWFHLGCVGLTDIPDVDEWFCESCAADAAPDDEDDDDDDDEM